MEDPLQSFFSREDRGEVFYSYLGDVTPQLTLVAFQYVEASEVLAGEEPEIRRAVFRAFVETLQNLFHHGESPETEAGRGITAG